MIIYLIRHPQTEWNIKRKVQGHKDSPLTKSGKELATKMGNLLKNKNIKKIISSDLGRCVQTAEIVSKKIGDVRIIFTNNLRERDFGELNGQLNKKSIALKEII